MIRSSGFTNRSSIFFSNKSLDFINRFLELYLVSSIEFTMETYITIRNLYENLETRDITLATRVGSCLTIWIKSYLVIWAGSYP